MDNLIFLALAILGGAFKPKLLVMRDLSELLSSLKGMNELVEVSEVIRDARKYRDKTPESMIITELSADSGLKEVEAQLAQNDYFAERWWEIDRWEYREDIEVSLMSAEDALGLEKSSRIFIDIRDFEAFSSGHIKSS